MRSRSNVLPIDSDGAHLKIEEKVFPMPIEVWPIYIIPHLYCVQHQQQCQSRNFSIKKNYLIQFTFLGAESFGERVYYPLSVILNDKFQDYKKKKEMNCPELCRR